MLPRCGAFFARCSFSPRCAQRHTLEQWVIPTALKVSTRKAYSNARDFAASMCTGADAGVYILLSRSFPSRRLTALQLYYLLSIQSCTSNFAAPCRSERASVVAFRRRRRKCEWSDALGALVSMNARL